LNGKPTTATPNNSWPQSRTVLGRGHGRLLWMPTRLEVSSTVPSRHFLPTEANTGFKMATRDGVECENRHAHYCKAMRNQCMDTRQEQASRESLDTPRPSVEAASSAILAPLSLVLQRSSLRAPSVKPYPRRWLTGRRIWSGSRSAGQSSAPRQNGEKPHGSRSCRRAYKERRDIPVIALRSPLVSRGSRMATTT
jgi:hypothetical protein